MFRLNYLSIATGILILAVSGCATGRNYQIDIDALNSKVSVLQGQLSAKDGELSRLQNQLAEQQSALSQAETDKRLLNEKLVAAASQLAAQKTKNEETASQKVQKPAGSDLK